MTSTPNRYDVHPPPDLQVVRLRPEARLPTRATPDSAGLDLYAARDFFIPVGHRHLVPTGIAIALRPGLEGQIRPRSGLANSDGITVLNAPGTIDADYRGEVGVLLVNHGTRDYQGRAGERIAQLVVAPVHFCRPVEVETLEETGRGAGGWGSSGA